MDWRPWMDAFLPPLLEALPGRVAFVGIQGSFGRGEAGPESDVDLVVVLDALGAALLFTWLFRSSSLLYLQFSG